MASLLFNRRHPRKVHEKNELLEADTWFIIRYSAEQSLLLDPITLSVREKRETKHYRPLFWSPNKPSGCNSIEGASQVTRVVNRGAGETSNHVYLSLDKTLRRYCTNYDTTVAALSSGNQNSLVLGEKIPFLAQQISGRNVHFPWRRLKTKTTRETS